MTNGLKHPYLIGTAADLILLDDSPEDYDKHFVLTADIDRNPDLRGRRVFDRAVIAQGGDSTGSPSRVSLMAIVT